MPCNLTPCTASNTVCTNNGDATTTCSCASGYVATDGSDPNNGCDCKLTNKTFALFMEKNFFYHYVHLVNQS